MVNNIVPTPKKVELFDGTANVPFLIECDKEDWRASADLLSRAFEKLYDKPLAWGKGGIRLICDPTMVPGSYKLMVGDGVSLIASDKEGILYSMATLIQAATVKDGEMTVERVTIEDYPEKDNDAYSDTSLGGRDRQMGKGHLYQCEADTRAHTADP